jgi:NADH-quinone oxidoreductase subunit L
LGIFLIYYLFNSLDYAVVFALAPHFKDYSIVFFNYEVNALTLICFFFFVGATGKSAQIGLHT